MAANLVRAGYDVRGFDLVPLLRDNAAKEGVSIAASAKEAFEGAKVARRTCLVAVGRCRNIA
jgi:3-hydroxyisobutyrate dehydrogenase